MIKPVIGRGKQYQRRNRRAAFGPDAVLNQMNVTNSTRGTLIPDALGSVIGSLDAASGEFTKTGYQTYGEKPQPCVWQLSVHSSRLQ